MKADRKDKLHAAKVDDKIETQLKALESLRLKSEFLSKFFDNLWLKETVHQSFTPTTVLTSLGLL